MIKILAIILAVTSYGCSSHLDKNIFEPLTVEELKNSIERDSTFKDTYQTIQQIKDSVLNSDIEKVKFTELTYNRIHKLIKFSQDSTYFKPITEQLSKEWKEKYGGLESQVDSISNYWKKYKGENS